MDRRWLAVPILLGAFCAPAFPQEEEFQKRRAAVREDDPQGLLDLGIWCGSRGGSLERRARECFEDLLYKAGPVRDKAAYRLAQWYSTKGRGYADAQLAADLLSDLVSRGAEPAAARDLDLMRQVALARKRDAVERANEQLVRGQVLFAAKALAQARRQPFGRASGQPELDASRLYECIAQAIKDSERDSLKFNDPALPSACALCAGSGFEPCATCKGKGKIKTRTKGERVLTPEGITYVPPKEVEAPCGNCGAVGQLPCDKCRSTGVDFALLDEEGKKAFSRFGTWLRNQAKAEDPVKAVMRSFAETVESRLRVPGSLRAAIQFPLIPPTREAMDLASLKAFWGKAKEKEKIQLVRGVTILSARWLEPFFFHSGARKTLGEKDPFQARFKSVPLPPEVPGSDPWTYDDRWIHVAGEVAPPAAGSVYNTVAVPWKDDYFWFDLKGRDGPHMLRTFVWTEKSREKHRVLPDIHPEFEYLKRFAWTYPYTLEAEVKRLRPGTVVVLYGRMVRQEGRYPSQALEVWGIDAATDGAKVLPPRDAPPPASVEAAPADRAALLHWRALQELRTAPADANGRVAPRFRAVEALRDALDLYERELANKPDDAILQESHAQTHWLLHALLAGKWWPK